MTSGLDYHSALTMAVSSCLPDFHIYAGLMVGRFELKRIWVILVRQDGMGI